MAGVIAKYIIVVSIILVTSLLANANYALGQGTNLSGCGTSSGSAQSLSNYVNNALKDPNQLKKEWIPWCNSQIYIGEMFVPLGSHGYFNLGTFYDVIGNETQVVTSALQISKFIEPLNHNISQAQIIFLNHDIMGNHAANIALLLYYDNGKTNLKKEFAYINVTSTADPHGILLIMEEQAPNAHVFSNIGMLKFVTNGTSSDFDYGPILKVNATDVITATFNYNGTTYSNSIPISVNPNPSPDNKTGYSGAAKSSGSEGSSGVSLHPSVILDSIFPNCTANGGDTDHDGICNNYEPGSVPLSATINGITYNGPTCGGTGKMDPVCPSPTTKDIFIEDDLMKNYQWQSGAQTDLINAFLGNKPSSSPTVIDSRSGTLYPKVQLHLEDFNDPFDPTGNSTTTCYTNGPVTGINFPNYTGTSGGKLQCNDFDYLKERNILQPELNNGITESAGAQAIKEFLFHYALFTNTINEDTGSSGLGEQYGNDMVISLGNQAFQPISKDEQEGTFMHELGHNLGLYHGGTDSVNCKPNYLSVMNYIYQFPWFVQSSTTGGAVATRPLDYSQAAIGASGTSPLSLNSGGYRSSVTITQSTPSGLYLAIANPPTTGSTPWFYTIQAGSTPTSLPDNLNEFSTASPSVASCTSTSAQNLNGAKDWSTNNINYDFYNSVNYGLSADFDKGIRDMLFKRINATIYMDNNLNSSTIQQNLTSYVVAANNASNNDQFAQAVSVLDNMTNTYHSFATIHGITNDSLPTILENTKTALKLVKGLANVTIDSSYYSPNSQATVTVNDPDFTRNNPSVNSIQVHLTSTTDGNGIDLTLAKNTTSDLYQGTVSLSNQTIPGKELNVSSGDSVVATYDGAFHTSAIIYPNPPPPVQQLLISPSDFSIPWNYPEPAGGFPSSPLYYESTGASINTTKVQIMSGASLTKGTCTTTNCFDPQVLNISAGDTVTWTNSDTVGHTSTSGKPRDNQTGTVWDSSLIKAGGIYSFTFQNAGTYNYFCQVHPWMTGQIIVGPAASSGTTTGATMSGNTTSILNSTAGGSNPKTAMP